MQTKNTIHKHLMGMREIKVKVIKIFTCESGCHLSSLLGYKKDNNIIRNPLLYGQIKNILKNNEPALIVVKRTKNNTPYFIPITPEIIEIVNTMLAAEKIQKQDTDPLFGKDYTVYLFDQASQRAAKLVGLESRDTNAQANRRYFKNILTKAECPNWAILSLMGYNITDKQELFEIWMNYHKLLNIY